MRSVQTIRRLLLLGAVTCALAAGSVPGEAQSRANHRTEAEDLRRFADFVEWPQSTNGGNKGTGTINFCVLGKDPFGASLDEFILGHPVGGRMPTLVRGKRFEDLGSCDVLFVSSSETKFQSKILNRLNRSPVLTVGETIGFAASGGIIQFVPEGDRVGFLINVDAAGRTGLKLRAELLALAHVVHDNPAKRGG